MRAGKMLITIMFITALSHPAFSATLEEKLNTVSNHMNLTVFVEDSVKGTQVYPLPANISSMDHNEIIRIAVRGYSHAMMYDEDGMAKLWVYGSNQGKFTKIMHTSGIQTASPARRRANADSTRITSKPIALNTPVAKPVNFTGFNNKGIKSTFSGTAFRENSFGFREPAAGMSLGNDFSSRSTPVRRPGSSLGTNSVNPRRLAKEMNEQKGLEFSAQMQGARRRLMIK